jgi:hypothetical protein
MPNGKERPGAQLGDPQLRIAGGAGQHPRPVPVALAGAGAGALVRDRADHRGELGFDQCWVDSPGRLPDPVITIGGLECLQDFQQCRLVQGHRVLISFRENHWRGLADHHTAACPARSGTPSEPITYTTRGDAAVESNGRALDRVRSEILSGYVFTAPSAHQLRINFL